VSLSSDPSGRRAPGPDGARMSVVLGCHHLVCALPIAGLDRLALPDAAKLRAAPGRPGSDSTGGVPAPDVVRVGEQDFAAWDLGELLGLAPLSGAWVLLRVKYGGKDLPLALRTGPCFAVQELRRLMPLPPAIFQGHRPALSEAFATSAVRTARLASNVGLWIDPARLWQPGELEASATMLEAVASATGSSPPA
jgi:hypothetical protein